MRAEASSCEKHNPLHDSSAPELWKQLAFLGACLRIELFQLCDPTETFITEKSPEEVRTFFQEVLLPAVQVVNFRINFIEIPGTIGGDVSDYYACPATSFALTNVGEHDVDDVVEELGWLGIHWPMRRFVTENKVGMMYVVTCREVRKKSSE